MDYIGIKTYHADGRPKGEIRFVGLFTSQAYVSSPGQIPLLRHKIETVLKGSGYPAASHAGKALLNVLDTFPRDELFQIDARELQTWSEGILDLETRPRVRLFTRIDRFDRFVSALLYVPRDRYNSGVREQIGKLLSQVYEGRIAAFYPYFPEGPLVRVQFIVARLAGPTPQADVADLERRIVEIVRTWEDRLADAICALGTSLGEDADALLAKYGTAFSAGYAETFPAERALEDLKRIERLGAEHPVVIDFYRVAGMPEHRIHAAVYALGAPIRLSERVPVLENLGFSAIDERSYHIRPRFEDGERDVALHDMVLETSDGAPIALERHDKRLEGCFLAVLRGEADNDGFNRLIVSAGAEWREAAVLRAYAAYLRQLGSPFGLRYLADTLTRHAGLARDLIELFHLRFDPHRGLGTAQRQAAEEPVRQRIEGALAAVPSLDEDRILRQFHNLVDATVRTSFYQSDAEGRRSATLAFKLDSKAVEAAPQPRPFREIWVYSPRVEAIHLRFAPIARGGIRWSDRAQDFRTEVLGLVRAQLVKNAVIVPSGAKGGFLPKLLPRTGGREEIQKEGVAAYRIFISALLDITDNIKQRQGRTAAPRGAPRRRRPLSGGRGRQGHRHLLRHRQRHLGGARLLARRRVRLRRLGRLRPQGHGDHGARRLGVRQAAFPRDGHRHPAPAVPRGGRRRHVGRRIRQRHAALPAHRAGGGVRPPRHLHRSQPRGAAASPSAGACSICRARAGRTTTRPRSPGAAAYSRVRPSRSRSATRSGGCSKSRPQASPRPS